MKEKSKIVIQHTSLCLLLSCIFAFMVELWVIDAKAASLLREHSVERSTPAEAFVLNARQMARFGSLALGIGALLVPIIAGGTVSSQSGRWILLYWILSILLLCISIAPMLS